MSRASKPLPILCILSLLLFTGAARAQGTARSLDLDPSIRSTGMGGASAAVFWGGDANWWANPALLGYCTGTRFEHGRTQLVPGLASDVHFTTNRYTIGGGGLGIALAGRPLSGLGNIELDYGSSVEVDPGGNEIGTFDSYEKIRSWAAGLSVAGLIESWPRREGKRAPAFTRWADLAVGLSQKHVDIALAPPSLSGTADATTYDFGLLLRAIPFDNTRGGVTPQVPVRVDLAYGHSILNFNDVRVTFINEAQASPTSRIYFDGWAVHGEVGLPAAVRKSFGSAGWLADSFDPALSVGLAWDNEHVQAGDDASHGYDVRHDGVEVAFANVLWWRTGHLEDKLGDRIGDTSGWGLGFRLGRFAGFRYDFGTLPQASTLPDVERRGYTIFVDPVAFYRTVRGS